MSTTYVDWAQLYMTPRDQQQNLNKTMPKNTQAKQKIRSAMQPLYFISRRRARGKRRLISCLIISVLEGVECADDFEQLSLCARVRLACSHGKARGQPLGGLARVH